MSDDAPFKWQYFFTIDARLDGTPVGDVPGGFRIDIVYEEGGRVWTDGEKYFSDWIAKNGELEGWWKPIEGLPIDGLPKLDELKNPSTAYDKIATLRKLGKFDPYAPEIMKRTPASNPRSNGSGRTARS